MSSRLTEGGLYATLIEQILFLILIYKKNKDEKKTKLFIKTILFVLFLTGLMTLEISIHIHIIYQYISILIAGTFFQIWIYKHDIKYSLLIEVIFLSLKSMSVTISICLLTLVLDLYGRFADMSGNVLLIGILMADFVLLLLILVSKKLLKNIQNRVSISNWLIIFIPIVLNLILMMFIEDKIYNWESPSTESSIFMLALSFFMIFGMLCNIGISEYYLKVREIEHKARINMEEMQIRYDYYRGMKEDMDEVRKLHHDIKNHLFVLEETSLSESKTSYIGQLHEKIQNFESRYDTGNEFLDVVLHKKKKLAEKRSIRFDVQIYLDNSYGIADIDLCTIFTNAIDNAIEECEQLPEDQERILLIRTKKVNSFFSITFENSLRNDRESDINKRMETSKSDKKRHGFGMNNIKDALGKYDGEYSVCAKNGMFFLYIIIPCKM